MFINRRLRELNLKIVYHGPATSGKTTNLVVVHKHTNPGRRGEMVSLKTREDRTIFFDYIYLELGKVNNLTPKIHLYTVPGQVYYAATRKLVLRGADGIVFVADSQPSRIQHNVASWSDMESYIQELGLGNIPVVVQFNKRDLSEAVPVEVLRRAMNLEADRPVFEAVAIEGVGVFDALKAIISQVIAHINRQIKSPAR
ncbi:MAG: gliding-motility protein MglA [Anaerolineae bacterium]|nr:gliding-motility protein MglA [Anaerolineae bacterium]